MPLSTILYNFPFRILLRPCHHFCKTVAITLPTLREPHCSNAIDTATLLATTIKSVILADNGSIMSVNISWIGFGGAKSTNMLKADKTTMENINQAIWYVLEISSLMSVARRNAPFVHMDLRYGGPMLKTAATSIYWKHEMTKSIVFSKLVDSRLLPSEAGSFSGGGVYLCHFRFFHVLGCWAKLVPWLFSYPQITPELESTRDQNLTNDTCKDFFGYQSRCRALWIDFRIG